MFKSPLIAAALFVIPGPALAQIVFVDSPQIAPPTKAERSKSDWDKIVCRAQNTLGSRLERNQVCLTKWQWYMNEQESKQRVQDWQVIGSSSH